MNSPRNHRPVVLAVLITAVVVSAIGAVVYYQYGPGAASPVVAPVSANQTVSVVNGRTIVTLDTAVQTQSGIQAEPLVATEHGTETAAYGTVLDLQPLFELRSRYLTAHAEADATSATATESGKEAERDRILFQDNRNVSLKAFQVAQAKSLADRARMQAADANLQNIKGAVLQQAGATIGGWLLEPQSAQIEPLLIRQEILLRVTLPPGDSMRAPATIQVVTSDNQRHPAYLVSASAQNDPAIQGSAFVYRTAALIASGSNVAVFLPAATQAMQGIVIPANAIVWHGGGPWAYVQINETHFERRPVAQQAPVDGGYQVSDGFKAGERIVVRGAQLLLSEELRPPPGGAACKDPECD